MSRFLWHFMISLIVCICVGMQLILIKHIFGGHVLANLCICSLPSAIAFIVLLINNKEK